MTAYTFYQHQISGDIAPLSNWQSDYRSMDPGSWHGKEPWECNPADWLVDGKLQELELHSDDECTLTNRVFHGWWGDVAEGDSYVSEWQCSAKDGDGNDYLIVWQFPAVKGDEPEDDAWPWGDESFIYSIKAI